MRLICYSHFFSLIFLFISCGGSPAKKGNNYLEKGEYHKAYAYLIKKYIKEKPEDRIDIAPLLQEAYEKSLLQDERNLKQLQAETLPSTTKDIYYTYLGMSNRQKEIEFMEPINSKNGKLNFTKKDYSRTLAAAKTNYINYTYTEALKAYILETVGGYRTAYDLLTEIKNVAPNYKETNQMLDIAKVKGTLQIGVIIYNSSYRGIPIRLQENLLSFTNYGLPEKWTNYHVLNRQTNSMDLYIEIYFNDYNINRYQSNAEYYRREKTISSSTEGEQQIVFAHVTRYRNIVEATMYASASLLDTRIISNRNVSSTYKYQDIRLTYSGDIRALTSQDLSELNNRNNYPGDEYLINQCSEEFIQDLNGIFRNERDVGLDITR